MANKKIQLLIYTHNAHIIHTQFDTIPPALNRKHFFDPRTPVFLNRKKHKTLNRKIAVNKFLDLRKQGLKDKNGLGTEIIEK